MSTTDNPTLPGTERIPLVTIGLPVFNGAQDLEAAVRSLLNQTERDFVLLISDNGSTDATPELCARLAEEDARIRYVRHETNMGSSRNWEYVLREARSPFFMWAAHDDLRAPNYLAVALELLRGSPDAIGCMTALHLVDAKTGQHLRNSYPPPGLASCGAFTRARAVFHDGHFAIFGLFRLASVPPTLRFHDVVSSDLVAAFYWALHGRFVVVRQPLLTFRYVPFEERQKGEEGYLYMLGDRQSPAHSIMWRDTRESPLSPPTKALIGAYLLAVNIHDWRRVQLRATRQRVREAAGQRRYLEAMALSAKYVALRPTCVAGALKRRIGRLAENRSGWHHAPPG